MEREEWLANRIKGIGASEAAAIVGKSPYMNTVDLWRLKTGQKQAEDISEKPYVQYGTRAEEYLRGLYALDHPEYQVIYDDPYKMIHNKNHPFIFATLDGELLSESGEKGILEIKTTEIRKGTDWEKWEGKVPDNYYIQLLHQLLATGWDFAVLCAQIKYTTSDGGQRKVIREYEVHRNEVEDDLQYLWEEEMKFWGFVENKRMPPLILPI